MKKLIAFPFAYIKEHSSGVNVKANKKNDIYLKNLCVSAISARNNSDASIDVAVVVNFDIPYRYKDLLLKNNIKIFEEEFDLFLFSQNFLWNLAFYKLDVMYKIAHKYDYDFFIYLDSDVFVQDDLNYIFEESKEKILLYDIGHGLQVNDYQILVNESSTYFNETKYITHFGGEFFSASKQNAIFFSEKCYEIFKEMILRDIKTTKGDEFILSIAASKCSGIIKNAGAYIYRYWTGSFRLVSTNYINNKVSILHCPAEKERGFIRIFKKYYNGKKVSNKKAHKMLHISKIGFRNFIWNCFQKIRGT